MLELVSPRAGHVVAVSRSSVMYSDAGRRSCRRAITSALVATILFAGTPLFAQTTPHPILDATGFHQTRGYVSEAPFEQIDSLSGGLTLTHTDLVIPGNAGWDLPFQRTYHSKDGRWTFGLADIPFEIAELWNPQDGMARLVLADGSTRHLAFTSGGIGPDPLGVTRDFWRYDRADHSVRFPNGRRCTYTPNPALAFPLLGMRVTACADPFGNALTFTWSAMPTPTLVVTQSLGATQTRNVTFTMNTDGSRAFPTSMTYAGRTWTFSSTAVTLPEGSGWTYAYDNELTRVTTPHGGVIDYTYDTEPYATDEGGQHVTVVVRQRATSGTLPAGVWQYDYQLGHEGRTGVGTVRTPSGARSEFTYGFTTTPATAPFVLDGEAGSVGLLQKRVQRQQGNGNNYVDVETEDLAYAQLPLVAGSVFGSMELSGRALTRVVGNASRTYTTAYSYGATNFADYHRPFRIVETGDFGVARTTTRVYAHLLTPYVVGLPLSDTTEVSGSAEQFTRAWEYASSTGFRTAETLYGIRTTFAPDARGNVAAATRADGTATAFTYDWGVLKDTITAAQSGAPNTTTRVINADGTVASQTQAGRTTSFTYDGLFRVRQVQPPGGTSAIATDYDPSNTLVSVTRGPSVLTTTLDGFGRPVATLNSQGVRTRTAFDAEGRVIYQGAPHVLGFGAGDVGATLTYDPLGRLVSRTDPGGGGNGPQASVTTWTYGLGTVTIRDQENRTTVQTLQAFGDPSRARLVSVRDAANHTWQYAYDALDQLRAVTAPDGSARTWTYAPGTNRLTAETHPESGTTTFGYTVSGLLQQRTDARGTSLTYAYDAHNRLASIAAGTQTTSLTYEPGSDNRLTATVDGITTTFAYDAAGRLAGRMDQLDGNPFVTTYTYDGNDDLTAIEYPSRSGSSRRRVTYTYDSEHRPTAVREGSRDYATNLQYHPSGAVLSFLSGNQVQNTFGYDLQRYWPTSVATSAANWALTYDQYDKVGNVGRITDARPAFTQTFRYDALDRLDRAVGPYGTITYAYDAHGNRVTAGGTTYVYQPGTLRLIQQGVTTFGYDANGNLTSDVARTYTYTPDNQIATITPPGGAPPTTLAYDADQWRIKKTAAPNTPTTYYLRGPGGQLLTEWRTDGGTAQVKDYISVGSRLVATVGRTVTEPPPPPPPVVCQPVIRYDFTTLTGPLYPTNSPGGPAYSLPFYWQTPVWPSVISGNYGAPLPTFPDLVYADQVDVVNGRLTYLADSFGQLGFGHALPSGGSNRPLAPLFSLFNNGRRLYAQADVEFSADVYNSGALVFPVSLFRIFADREQFEGLELRVDAPAGGPIRFVLEWLGLEGGATVVAHTRTPGSIVGQTVRVRVEATPSTPVDPTDFQNFDSNADGQIRLFLDNTLVFETTTASFQLRTSGMAEMPEAYTSGGIGIRSFVGPYRNLDFGYCGPVGQ